MVIQKKGNKTMNTNDLINKVNFNGNKTAYIYISAGAYSQYKVGHTIDTKTRVTAISIGSFWKHKLLCKIEVEGLVTRLETNVLNDMENKGFKRNGEVFLIPKKTREEVSKIFQDIVSTNIKEMRRQIRAKSRYETKVLAEHGINNAPIYTSIARA